MHGSRNFSRGVGRIISFASRCTLPVFSNLTNCEFNKCKNISGMGGGGSADLPADILLVLNMISSSHKYLLFHFHKMKISVEHLVFSWIIIV